MRKILLLLTLIALSLTTFSQQKEDKEIISIQNFKYNLNTKQFVWQKIYDCKDISEVLKHLNLMRFVVTYRDSTTLIGNTEYKPLPYDKNGLGGMKYKITLNCPTVIFFTIDVKENKYKVTVTKIECHVGSPILDKAELQFWYIKGDKEFRKVAFTDMPLMNAYLSDIFEVKDQDTTNDNW